MFLTAKGYAAKLAAVGESLLTDSGDIASYRDFRDGGIIPESGRDNGSYFERMAFQCYGLWNDNCFRSFFRCFKGNGSGTCNEIFAAGGMGQSLTFFRPGICRWRFRNRSSVCGSNKEGCFEGSFVYTFSGNNDRACSGIDIVFIYRKGCNRCLHLRCFHHR